MQNDPITLDEYDRLKVPEGEIWELHQGYIVAFSTGSEAHGILCARIASVIRSD